MNTYTALISAQVGTNKKIVKTEVKALNASDAKWLLQAIYGFHAVTSNPVEKREFLTDESTAAPPTPEQQRLNALKATKDKANDALKVERDRQKRSKALKVLSTI